MYTAQKMKFSIKDFFSKCHQTCSLLRIWSHLLKKTLMENFVFYAALFGNAYSGVLHTIFNLKNLIAKLSYFKNLEGPTVIDHILTNHTISLHHPGTYETELSDFYELTCVVLKTLCTKLKPKFLKLSH